MAQTACTAIVPFAAVGPAAQWQALADERMQATRTIAFPASSAVGHVLMQQIPGKALGAYAWTAGVELACYIERRYAGRLRDLRILELGSGTGITGIALAKLGACVVCTDMFPELVALMRKNISAAGLESTRCRALPFEWGNSLPGPLLASFDLVIGSEITYNESGFKPLANTLRAVCEAEQARAPTVVIAETLRNSRQPECWSLLGRDFVSREVFAAPQHDSWNIRDAAAPVRIFELQWRQGALSSPSLGLVATPAVCPRVATVAEVNAALEEHGACILVGGGLGIADAAAAVQDVFGGRLRAAAEPAVVSEESFRVHSEGLAYGDLFPDFFLLLCARLRRDGGTSFLVDGYAVLDALAADLETAWLPSVLEIRPVDQASQAASAAPVVVRAPCGRRAVRCSLPGTPGAPMAQGVAANSDDAEADAAMLAAYHASVERAAAAAPRFFLQPGEALLVDNYRMIHGHDPGGDAERSLWRCLVWTVGSRGVPEGELHSMAGDTAAQSAAMEAAPPAQGGAVGATVARDAGAEDAPPSPASA